MTISRTGSPLIAQAVTQVYGSGLTATHALVAVNLTIAPGESVAIMGPSGSGKTTLLHCLAGILRPTSGSITWCGDEIATMPDAQRTALRREGFGFVFQSGQLLPELPAVENVALPLMLGGVPRKEACTTAARWLDYVGLGGMHQRRPGELSGGQAQRVAIARALVGAPGVVFADEPTGALDQATGHDMMQVLTQTTQAAGAALVVVTHDPDVASWCTRTITMQDGLITGEQRAGSTAASGAAPATSPVGATPVSR